MWSNLQFLADLVEFTAEIFREKLHFLCSQAYKKFYVRCIYLWSMFLESMERLCSPLFFTAQEKEDLNTVLVALNEKYRG